MISQERQPLVIAVTFVIALVSFVAAIYHHVQIKHVAEFYGLTTMKVAKAQGPSEADEKKMKDMEARIAKLETASAQAAAQPAGQPAAQPTE